MSEIEPVLSTFESQRLSLASAQWGDPSHPPLILVHGGRDQKRSWDWVARALATRFYVISYDLRGHGKSAWSSDGDYGVMDHVFDLASLVAHFNLERFHLIGHSLGGNIAVRYAGLYPEKIIKLVAIEGLGPSPKMQSERAAERLEVRLRAWIEQRRILSQRVARKMKNAAEARARMQAAFEHLSDAQISHLTLTGIRHNQDGTVSWAYDPAGMGRSPADITNDEFRYLYARITCPTWLVYGADSWASDPSKDGRAAHFQNAVVSVIPEAGHWVHHDRFEVFMSALEDFFLG